MGKKIILPSVTKRTSPDKKHAAVKAGKSPKKASSPSRTSKVSGGTNADRILKAIAFLNAHGTARPDKKSVQVASQILDNKVFATVCATMKNKGTIIYDRTTMQLTELGREQVGEGALLLAQPPTNDTFHDRIKGTFKSGISRSIFDILADGGYHTKDEIAQKLNIENNKSFGTYLSALSKYTNKGNNGTYSLKDTAFPFGRPKA